MSNVEGTILLSRPSPIVMGMPVKPTGTGASGDGENGSFSVPIGYVPIGLVIYHIL